MQMSAATIVTALALVASCQYMQLVAAVVPPPNLGDDSTQPIVITSIPATFSGDTSSGFINAIGAPTLGDGPDVFYSYTPTEDVSVTITTCGSSYDTEIGLFLADLTLIDSNDDELNTGPCVNLLQSALENIILEAGVTYLIVVDGFGEGNSGAYNLNIIVNPDEPPSPPNPPPGPPPPPVTEGDGPANPFIISTLPASVTENTSQGFTNIIPAPILGNGPDVWYSFTPTTTVVASVDTCGSLFDTEVGVFAENLTLIANNDDSLFCQSPTRSFIPGLLFQAQTTYFIVVDGFSQTEEGEFVLNIQIESFPPPSPPPTPPSPPAPPSPPLPEGDTFETAIVIESIPATLTGDTSGFSNSFDGAPLGDAPDTFYTFTATESTVISITTCGSAFDTEVGLFLEDQTLIDANDDGDCPGEFVTSELNGISITAGTTYFIAVDGFAETSSGAYVLNIFITPPPSPPGPPPSPGPPSGPLLDGDTSAGFTSAIDDPTLGDGPDIFFSFVPQEDVVVTIATCGSSYDTEIGVFSNDLTLISTNDDGDVICNTLQSEIVGLVLVGDGQERYFIAVDGFSADSSGPFVLDITIEDFPPPSPPTIPGDNFEMAFEIASIPTVIEGDTSAGFTNTISSPILGGGPDIFYKFTPDTDVVITVSTCGSSYDTEVGIFDQDENLIVTNDDSGYYGLCDVATDSSLENILLTGDGQTTYFIVIDGFAETAEGEFILNIELLPSPPTAVALPGDVSGDGALSVLDIVQITNTIVGVSPPFTGSTFATADLNSDGAVDVQDIIILVNALLGI